MHLAPDALINDGMLDMVIVGNLEKSELINIWLATYSGNHIKHPKVRLIRDRSFFITSSESVPLEVDGEYLGRIPAQFTVVPAALAVAVQAM